MNPQTDEPTPFDSTADTVDHINRVRGYLATAAHELVVRGSVHDRSKLEPEEKPFFDATTPRLAKMTYGSDEYRAALREIKPALEHHYANNSHHPEFYGVEGVNAMNLFDVLEMLCDWRAASERHDNGDIDASITHNMERFSLSPQLTSILRNTAKSMGWIRDAVPTNAKQVEV